MTWDVKTDKWSFAHFGAKLAKPKAIDTNILDEDHGKRDDETAATMPTLAQSPRPQDAVTDQNL